MYLKLSRGRCAALVQIVLSAAVIGCTAHANDAATMVREQIESRGIKDPAVLQSLRNTPRHLFVPVWVRGLAYTDQPLPIGHDATISQPYIVALMTELLEPSKDLTVLEIGTGSGYQAAVLSPLVKHVYTIEIVPELARSARATLEKLGYKNISVRTGNGYKGWPEKAPFDRILLTAAPPEIPRTLINQLRPGGKLVAPVGDYMQTLVVIDKSEDGKITRHPVIPVRFVPMVKGVEADK
jgi:protein-L-isoaspartate(D-aspartate) O-methyltransferase